ncbi:tetratricopeptide repeat protein [Chryseobacterium gwangjuense]|uniref:tetratricopeptide repeat protein n=1 Tax=Chryseobacterium gwangjuense TaxID=1069980 RepID=UPI001E2F84DC|nr:tetratricopeptide repeat protein [Chryseobacterium gwangjuense]MCE3075159.1 sel1 repeat family protein [Chryseobacterium gwangjuense]
MKKYLLILIILSQTTILFAQDWGPWNNVSCFKGIQYSVKNFGYDKNTKSYWWSIKWKNNYNEPVSFDGALIIDGEKSINGRFGTIKSGGTDGLPSLPYKSGSIQFTIEIGSVCFSKSWGGCSSTLEGWPNYADCDNGIPNYKINEKRINSTSTNNTVSNNQTTNSSVIQSTNDLSGENRGKIDPERQIKQNQQIDNRNAEAQQQQLLKQQKELQRKQELQQDINQLTMATVDLITYFSNRKNALRNSLSKEDGEALLAIANSENPTDYTQNIIDIFSDLGYTLRETERKDNYVIITLNNDVNNINDFMLIHIWPASYDHYNRITFSYHRKKKLQEQLAILGDKLKDLTIVGISPNNQQKKIKQDEDKLNEKTKRAKSFIEVFEKNNYWNSTKSIAFTLAKDIAEAYEDTEALNNKEEAIRYYKKAGLITLDELSSQWKGDKNMRAYQEKLLAEVYFKIGYLTDAKDGKEAIEWYHKSAGIFKINPFKNIARIYQLGLGGVEKNWKLAVENYEKAANEGDAASMNIIGKLYASGGYNLEKDESKSEKWLTKACKKDINYCK